MGKEPSDDNAMTTAVELFQRCIPVFSVLSDPNRQKIILALAVDERLNVSQLDERMSLSRPAISHHLKALKQAGIVQSEKQGTENYYFLTLEDTVGLLKELTSAIESDCFLK